MKSPNALLALILVSGALPFSAEAQRVPLAIEHQVEAVYAADIPVPEAVIGHQIGTRHTRPHQLVEYFRAVEVASDRVIVEQHALSYERRPLIHAVVTSPANLARIEEIRGNQIRLSDQPGAMTDSDLESMPVVVYMGYSIHGNEASGSEAGMLLLYHLAAGEGPSVEGLLDSAIVIIDVNLNPDGRDRFVDWVNGQRGGTATLDGQDREHNEPWPGGRTNHYWFDLNRDWLPAQHPESQGRIALFHQWRPQLVTDFHEMGGNATYFFQPGIPSRNNPNTPARVFELTGRLAEYHASALDDIGSLYYSEESFDDFYYGKGSTYPDVNGSVGILFEQASSRALERETVFGTLTYARSILNHFVTSLSTLEGAREMRVDFLRNQRDFYAEAPDVAGQLATTAYLLDLGPTRTRGQALAQTLQRHRVDVHQLSREVTVDGTVFRPGEAYVIPVDQPQVRFLAAAMERVTTFRDSLFYDVSAWTLPLAFGVETAPYTGDASSVLGAKVGEIHYDGGRVVGGPAEYAYVMPWGRFFGPRALYRALDAGVHPVLAREPFTVEVAGQPVRLDRGTVIIPVTNRDDEAGPAPEEVHRIVTAMAELDHVELFAVESGLTPSGPDLGGSSSRVVALPRIALAVGDGISSYEAGEVWHLLSERMEIPVSLVDHETLGSIDLTRYNRLVAVNGFGPRDSSVVQSLEQWIEAGGVLVAQRGAVGWVLDNDLLDETERENEADPADVPYANVGPTRGAQAIGGSILEVEVDATHPITYGQTSRSVFRSGTRVIERSTTPGADVAWYTEAPLQSGYVSDENLQLLAGSASIIARRKGRGAIILFLDDPNFRAFWLGSSGYFLNALFLGGSF